MLFNRMSSTCIRASSAVKALGNSYLQSTALKKWWPWWLLLPGCLASWNKYVEEYDSIRVARCDVRCGETHPDECMEHCLTSNYTKPGYCPDKAAMTPFEAACLIACIDDSRCPDLAKCCSHDCGVTCMRPVGLDNQTDLPPIPRNLRVRQQRGNLALLTWHGESKNDNDARYNEDNEYDLHYAEHNRSVLGKGSGIRYLIEERHLLGPRYLESRLTSWVVRHVSNTPHATLRGRLKTGHWYQFRVAAVNAHGSRGFSQPSRPLKTKEPRNPKEPENLRLSGARIGSGKLRITLHWTKPASDAPISFYKIFWSRLIRGPANDSILVYHRTVLKDKTCYELKNLELNCQYFLQVQAVALYGGRRLTSRKASKVFNSTDYTAYADLEKRSRRCNRHRSGLHVRRTSCHCGEVEARLVWPMSPHATMYNVTWAEDQCPSSLSDQNNHRFQPKILWQLVQAPRLDLRHLQRDCTYGVNVRHVFHDGHVDEHGFSIEFFAAGCQKKHFERSTKHPRRNDLRCKIK